MKSKIIYRRLAAFVFLAAFFAQSFSKFLIMADYYTNTSKYAGKCENKAKPKMRCNGKCQMMKKLQEEDKKDQENPDRKAENKNEVLLSSKSFFASIALPVTIQLSKEKFLFLAGSNPTDRSFAIFHPPQA